MHRNILFLLAITAFIPSFAQEIIVFDKKTKKPIENVYIYHISKNANYTARTNQKGIASITHFPSGIIILQHSSYYEQNTEYNKKSIRILLEEKVIKGEDVVILANKWEQSADEISQQISTISKKEIQFQNPETSADLIAQSRQVFVQKSQLGGGSPKIRGFAANGVLLVVDGIRMNNAIFRSGNLQNIINIDANAIESSEVIFGPGSVTYGSDAMGGVMDFHTIQPEWQDSKKINPKGNALLRYSSASNEKTGHLDFSLTNKKISFFQSFSYSSFGDLMAGKNRTSDYKGSFERKYFIERRNNEDILVKNKNINLQKFSGYNLVNSISKIRTRLGKSSELGYSFYFSTTSEIPRYDNLTQPKNANSDSLKFAKWNYGAQKWQMHRLSFNHFKKSILFEELKWNLAYQKFEESRIDRKFGSNKERTHTEKVGMISSSIDSEKKISQITLHYGVDTYYNKVSSDGFKKDIQTNEIKATTSRYPNLGSHYFNFASYINSIYNPTKKLTINAGIRHNIIKMTASTNDSLAKSLSLNDLKITNSALNGSLGISFRPIKNHKVYANISSGFRAPNIDDIGKIFEVGKKITIPNAQLKPEKSLSNELGYEVNSSKFNFNLVGFYSFLFDAITEAPTTINGKNTYDGFNIFHKTNSSKAEIYGFSLFSSFQFHKNWSLTGSISYSDGKDLSNNQPLRHTNPLFGKASLNFTKDKLKTILYTNFNGARTANQIPDSEIKQKSYLYTTNGSPSWATLNWKMSYQFIKNMTLNLGIENIFDLHYRPYSSGISAPGRNYIIAIRGSF